LPGSGGPWRRGGATAPAGGKLRGGEGGRQEAVEPERSGGGAGLAWARSGPNGPRLLHAWRQLGGLRGLLAAVALSR
jgi:hypothetical protein